MGAKAKDLTGHIFNRLVVIERIENQIEDLIPYWVEMLNRYAPNKLRRS